MADLVSEIGDLEIDLDNILDQLNISSLEGELMGLTNQINEVNFWQDSENAKVISQKQSKLEKRLAPWLKLRSDIKDLTGLAKLNDDSLKSELESQLNLLRQNLDNLKSELKFAGPYDDHDVVISLQAGAGGTDAQDWTEMLYRMYSRYAEKNSWKITLIDESVGDETGFKSVTMGIDGDFVYGKLKGEHGVHRLVRLSPFNSGSTRETSFALVEVAPKIDQPGEVEIDEKDLKIDVYRSGGHGGQSVNTTDSAVRVTHLPTGIVVAIQNERSQLQNKELALAILRSKLAQLQIEQHAERLSELKPITGANEFGSQIRNYVLHPYKQVKDLRTGFQSSDPDAILSGELDGFVEAYLDYSIGKN